MCSRFITEYGANIIYRLKILVFSHKLDKYKIYHVKLLHYAHYFLMINSI